MRIIIWVLLFQQIVISGFSQSNYFKSLIKSEALDVIISTKIIDTCKYLEIQRSDCHKRDFINFEKLTAPKNYRFENGKVIKSDSINPSYPFLYITRYSKSTNQKGYKEIIQKVQYPLDESSKRYFDPNLHTGVSTNTDFDTIIFILKNDKPIRSVRYGNPTFYAYEENKLVHKISYAGVNQELYTYQHQLIEESLAQINRNYLPYKGQDGNYSRKETPLGGTLGEFSFRGNNINIIGKEDFFYNKENQLITKIVSIPPFTEVEEYYYDKKQLLAVRKTHIGETGYTRAYTMKYQYDKSGYHWPKEYVLEYDGKQLVTVIQKFDSDGVPVDNNYEGFSYDVVLYRFEYDSKGRLEKEIVPDKVEFIFSYK